MSDYARDAAAERRRDPADQTRTRAPGTLYVVATPIGNLEDITLRALRVLREVTVVAAEDTRRSSQLLRHYNIATSLVSLHAHNERQRGEQLVARLLRGESVALVSDAGTPGISDPGAVFVRAARAAGIPVAPLPGASAVGAILSASGLNFDRYAYAGFPPIRVNDRKKWLEWVGTLSEVPVVCFEAPHRIERSLAEFRSFFVNRPIILARELTKLHEQWLFLDPTSVPSVPTPVPTASSIPTKGEFSFIICPAASPIGARPELSDDDIAVVFGQITESPQPGSRRQAVKAAAQRLGLSTKSVYEALERVKKATQT